jgi:gliding motility-associated-like protein
MVITVNPSPTVTVNSPTICPTQTATLTATGASSYTWSIGATLISTNSATASPVSTTSYTVTGSNAGCISIAVSTVTVSNNLSVTVNSPTICSGQTATLTASGATSYLWSVGANSTGVATAAVNPIVTSTYTVTGTSGGCTGTAVATITVNSALNVTVNDATICAGQTAILTANGANNYTWSAGANTTGVNTANASPAATTTYTVTGISGSCTNTAMATVNVNLPFAITINNPTICAGLQATLTANGATSYSWSSGLTATSNNTATVSPASTTTYTVIGTLSGCTNSATATVTVNALPTITSIANIVQCANTSITFPIFTSNLAATNFSWTNSNNAIGLASIGNGNIPTFNGINSSTNPINSVITVSPTGPAPSNCAGTPTTFTITINPSPIVTVNNTSICNGQTATLTANGANSYVWSNGATATTALANIVQTSPSLTTSYTVTGTSYGCSNSAVANVVVNNGPAITINSPTICNGQSATLTAIGSAAYTWSVGAIPAGTNTAIVSPITTSTFTVIGNSFGCVSTATTVVVVNPVPITNFTIPSQANINSNVSFVNTSLNGINYSWDFGDNTTSNETNPTHSYNSYGIFCTILTANNVGCTDTTMHCIEIASQFEFYLPSAFTPNGDGNNDYFAGIGFGFTDYEMSIYDRWGIKIFETNDIKNKWDGKVHYTGEIAKQDIYLYVVKLKDDNKIEKRYTGAVTLVK